MTFYDIIEKGGNGKEKVEKLYNFLKDGTYLITFQHLNPKSDEDTYRALYFMKISIIAGETGHSKPEMHEIVKEELIKKLYSKDSVSKGSLTLKEWVGLLATIELWAFQTYEIILP
jgi:alanine dehydrogenase